MAYVQATSLQVLGARVTKLTPGGAPLAGATNGYVSNAVIRAGIGLEYETRDAVRQARGDGTLCVSFPERFQVAGGTIEDMQFCIPDPNLLTFLIGGTALSATGTPPQPEVGYAAPQVGVDPNPNGVALELWTRSVIGGAFDAALPYIHWLAPCYRGQLSASQTLEETTVLTFTTAGGLQENLGWGAGPYSDWTWPTTRVWQWVRKATLPSLTPAFVPVV
ncbi:MAG: hypothetical protein ACRCZP_17675 [Phycicoccus sp.]